MVEERLEIGCIVDIGYLGCGRVKEAVAISFAQQFARTAINVESDSRSSAFGCVADSIPDLRQGFGVGLKLGGKYALMVARALQLPGVAAR